MAHFRGRNGLFRKPKWGILQCEEIPFKYKSLIFNVLCKPFIIRVFAPEECLFANTRLFFGVEWETKTEKSKSGYDLKVVHIVFISAD